MITRSATDHLDSHISRIFDKYGHNLTIEQLTEIAFKEYDITSISRTVHSGNPHIIHTPEGEVYLCYTKTIIPLAEKLNFSHELGHHISHVSGIPPSEQNADYFSMGLNEVGRIKYNATLYAEALLSMILSPRKFMTNLAFAEHLAKNSVRKINPYL